MIEKMNFDRKLFFAIVGLSVFGLIMMSSISVSSSFNVKGVNDFYFWRHFLYLGIGAGTFFAGLKMPIKILEKLALVIFIVGIGFLVSTLFIGEDYGTFAKLWIRVGPFSFQPVEATKLSIITFLAAFFSRNHGSINTLEGGLIPFAIVLGIPAILLMIQSDFGSLLVIALVSGAMYFIAGAKIKHLLAGVSVSIGAGIIIALSKPYILHRIKVFLDPSLDLQDTGFQVKQALIAIGSGGAFGRGFQNSIQKFDYLPEVQSDTIFSAISEEMGFFRILLLVGIYLFIAFRGYKIAHEAHDPFSKYMAFGITTWIVGQAFVNIAVNVALLPNTGLTLPLLSYGGTSMVLTLLSLGILLQISGQSKHHRRIVRW